MVGVLYDPKYDTDNVIDREEAEKLLRKQIKEILSWLKAEGIIN